MKKIVSLLFLLPLLSVGQIIEFEDDNFKEYLLQALAIDINGNRVLINTNQNNEIEVSEIEQVKSIGFHISMFNNGYSRSIDFRDLKQFSNVESIYFGGDYDANNFDSVILEGIPKLKRIDISFIGIEDIRMSNLPSLQWITTEYGGTGNSVFSNLPNLKNISLVGDGGFYNCTFLNLPLLEEIDADNNSNVGISFKNKVADFTSCPSLKRIDLGSRITETVNIQNGGPHVTKISGDSRVIQNIRYICCDPIEEDYLKSVFPNNTVVNTYCSFEPGGSNHTFQGQVTHCNSIIGVPFVKFNITEGQNTGQIISDKIGKFNRGLVNATQTITPILPMPYYTISPTSHTITFPTTSNTTVQDFCLTPIPDKNDLDIVISSYRPAIPGYDTSYLITYQNKGTTTQSGTISVSYQNDRLAFVSAREELATTDIGDLRWNFTDLKPLEKKYIQFTLNVNSPMEIPAVNSGDVLPFVATISSGQSDETPGDNSFTHRQNVVNSYDPNDKTCLEGNEILPEMVGEYLHYRIRFENTGTFAAQNIVVVDEIDETKFDLSTLIPIDSSHDMQTKVTGNKVEFIFENIMLPFEDATNDGYVVFKIKTLPSLKVGDSFSNQASIYFDFNFPIITNNETTTIVEEHLGVADFEFNQELTVYPNPVADRLYITSKSDAKIQSLEIYNLQGQLIQAVPQVTKMSFDVSHIPQGTYVIIAKTNKGSTTTKVIKE